jgi:hypothetical protein
MRGKGPQAQGLPPRGTHGIPRLKGQVAIPQLMRSTDLPLLSGVVLVGTVEVGHPHDRTMSAQPLLAHPVAPAWAAHMDADLGVLTHPCPLLVAVDAGPRLITAKQTATAQTDAKLRPPMVEARFDRLEQIGQGPCTDGRRRPQGGRQTLEGGPHGRAGGHPHWDRGPLGLPTVGTLTAIVLHTCAPRRDWGGARSCPRRLAAGARLVGPRAPNADNLAPWR